MSESDEDQFLNLTEIGRRLQGGIREPTTASALKGVVAEGRQANPRT